MVHDLVSDSSNGAGPRLFLDSADVADWARLLPSGVFCGVTTNPLLLERAKRPCTIASLSELAKLAVGYGVREIHLQAWGPDEDALFASGVALAGAAPKGIAVLIKVPASAAGFRAAARLRRNGQAITLTAIYHPGQLLAAAAAGAAYAAPYLGRLDDAGRDGRSTILAMHEILRGTGAGTRLLVASLRSCEQVIDLARMGLDTFTCGAPVASALLQDALADEAAAAFEAAARHTAG